MSSTLAQAIRCCIHVALTLTVVLPSAFAQSEAGTRLSGSIADSTNASMTSVTVTVARPKASFERLTTTNDANDWKVRFLSPGSYHITFEHRGFKTLQRDSMTVTTRQLATVQTVLEVGDVTEAVSVSDDAQMIATDTTTINHTLDRQKLKRLPTSTRNITQLLAIKPGVSANISELLSNDNASISPSVNGTRTTNNSFMFNNIDVTNMLCCNSRINGSRNTIDAGDNTLSRNIAPAPETLEKVKVQTSLYDASTKRNNSGIFQVVSKSDTNVLSDTAYDYVQNDTLLANDFFFNRANTDKPLLQQNEDDVTLNEPIVRNLTFFFDSYQATRAKTSFVDEASNTVLLPATLTDDRSNADIDRFTNAIWDTENFDPVNLTAISPTSQTLLQARLPDNTFLVPSGSSGFNCDTQNDQIAPSCEVLSIIPAIYEQDQFSFNVDHRVSDANRLTSKYFFSNQPNRDPLANSATLTLHEREKTTYQRTLSLTNVHVFGSSIINEVQARFFRNRNDSVPVSYHTNTEFRIVNPFANQVPNLSQITIDENDVNGELRFDTPNDDTRIFDRQTT